MAELRARKKGSVWKRESFLLGGFAAAAADSQAGIMGALELQKGMMGRRFQTAKLQLQRSSSGAERGGTYALRQERLFGVCPSGEQLAKRTSRESKNVSTKWGKAICLVLATPQQGPNHFGKAHDFFPFGLPWLVLGHLLPLPSNPTLRTGQFHEGGDSRSSSECPQWLFSSP